jgi:hypothetical protein
MVQCGAPATGSGGDPVEMGHPVVDRGAQGSARLIGGIAGAIVPQGIDQRVALIASGALAGANGRPDGSLKIISRALISLAVTP